MPVSSIPNKLTSNDNALKSEAAYLHGQAVSALESGNTEMAINLCRKAIELDPLVNKFHVTIAKALMPGNPYKRVIRRIHNTLTPKSYLEIGVASGASIALANTDTEAIGIDPKPRIKKEIPARTRIYQTTSDDFFERYNLFKELGHKQLDLAFIDGLHLFEQVLKDFTNVERYSTTKTVVLVHDCLPVTEVSTDRDRKINFWLGDVWKLIPCLKELRPDLNVNVIRCFPSGLAIITKLDSSSTKLSDNFDKVTQQYLNLSFQDIPKESEEYFSIVPNEWGTIKELLPKVRGKNLLHTVRRWIKRHQ